MDEKMTWFCVTCEDSFEEPTKEGRCPLCGSDFIQDENGEIYGKQKEITPTTIRVETCADCKFYVPEGVGFSSIPECMKYKENADNASKYCELLRKKN